MKDIKITWLIGFRHNRSSPWPLVALGTVSDICSSGKVDLFMVVPDGGDGLPHGKSNPRLDTRARRVARYETHVTCGARPHCRSLQAKNLHCQHPVRLSLSAMAEIDLSTLTTEGVNPLTANIDTLHTLALCHLINSQDYLVAQALEPCLPIVSRIIDALVGRIRRGGRVVYAGAGTSGRLGVLDASELPPTFNADPGLFLSVIAGGDSALRNSKEGAEDDPTEGAKDLHALDISDKDVVVGIAASGRTPYVLGALQLARDRGAMTVGVVCTSPSEMGRRDLCDELVEAVVGPEFVTGSTRLKAGTATKLVRRRERCTTCAKADDLPEQVLNMISTLTMVKLGKTYGNLVLPCISDADMQVD
jgi:N-acetylmuramic acid 6-phosphate etherase